jgi:hypothetical protein
MLAGLDHFIVFDEPIDNVTCVDGAIGLQPDIGGTCTHGIRTALAPDRQSLSKWTVLCVMPLETTNSSLKANDRLREEVAGSP